MRKRIYRLLLPGFLLLASCAGQSQNGSSAGESSDNLPTNPPNCTNSAAFVEDITVPDNTNFSAGENFDKVWRVKNTGTCVWNSNYKLVFVDGEQMGAPDSQPLSSTRSGSTLDISVKMTAPVAAAVYRADFELQDPSGRAMPIDKNTKLWVILSVGNAASSGSGSGASSGSSGAGGSGGPGFASVSCAYTTNQANVDAALAAINTYRNQNGLPAYTVNPQLSQAAQAHSADMACNQFFTHTGTNGSSPESRVAAAGHTASSVSENVYGRYPSPSGQEAVTWCATDQVDPRHNENLVSTGFTQVGIGYSYFDNFGFYVAVFTAP